jgi:hypothetical protein
VEVGQAARCVRVALKTRDLDWLPFVDALRTFCLSPTPEGRARLLGIRQFGSPISRRAASLEGLRP